MDDVDCERGFLAGVIDPEVAAATLRPRQCALGYEPDERVRRATEPPKPCFVADEPRVLPHCMPKLPRHRLERNRFGRRWSPRR